MASGPTNDHDDDDAPDDDEMPIVSASEAEVVTMARALTAPHAHDVWALLAGSRNMPAKMGPTSARLVGDALGQIWPALWKRDGARPGATVTGGKVKRGRGWVRHPVSALKFSPIALQTIRWLVATPLAATNTGDKLTGKPLAIGDQIVIYLALDISAGTPAQSSIARQSLVRATPLAWLGFPQLMAGSKDVPSFDELVTGPGSIVLEALQLDLAERWRNIDVGKRSITDPNALIALGLAQDATLDGFMGACDRAGRRDLAGFVIDAAQPLLEKGISPIPRELDPTQPMSVRAAARLGAGALLRGISKWQAWDERHRGVRFLDDDYEAAQLLLHRFEKVGRAGVDRSATWLAELASLAPTAPPSATVDRP